MKRAMTIIGNIIGDVDSFKYLRSFIKRDGCFFVDIKHWIKCNWIKERELSSVLFDKKVQ